jgi:hypothetical protein
VAERVIAENIDIASLTKLCRDALAETKAMRRDLADVQGLALKTVDVLTKLERRNEARSAVVDGRFAVVDARLNGLDQRMSDLKDDLELMVRRELMGAIGVFESGVAGLIEAEPRRKK